MTLQIDGPTTISVVEFDSDDTLDLEIVIPAYNEVSRLPDTLRELVSTLRTLPVRCSIVVVDNGSIDGTADIADRFATVDVPIRVIGCATPGKGAAVRRGMLSSRARWVGFCDADLATSLAAVAPCVSALADGVPVVIGSRRVPGAMLRVQHGLVRRVGSYGFRTLVRQLLPDVSDTQCGFKFFHADAAQLVFGDVVTNGFAFDVEILLRAARGGLTILEVPVTWESCAGSTFKPVRDGWKAANELYAIHRAADRRVGATPVAAVNGARPADIVLSGAA